MKGKKWPDMDYVKRRLDCDVESGKIKHKPRTPSDFAHTTKPEALAKSFNTRFAGKKWGQISGNGHHLGEIEGYSILAHHVVWMFAHGRWPEMDLNHINGNPADNRIDNLRIATKEDVARNLSMNVKNTSGVNGVHFNKARGKWEASIKENNKKIFLGRFENMRDAIVARAEAERELGYHENHGKRPSRATNLSRPAP